MNKTRSQKSLILVTVDCLRADHCGFHGYARPTTPFLDALAQEALVVPNAVVAGAPTFFSFPSILASRMPLGLGRDVVGLAPGENSLATILRCQGFGTAAFSAANPYISSQFGYDSGFEIFKDFLDFAKPVAATTEVASSLAENRGKINRSLRGTAAKVGIGPLYDELYFQYRMRMASPTVGGIDSLREFPSAEVIVDHAISWISSTADRPFFLWLHLMDAHSPYYPSPEAFRELTGRKISASRARYVNEFWKRSDLAPAGLEREKVSIVDLYDAGIRSMDYQVGKLVEHLKQNNLWNNCAFVLTADHGESLLEHGRRYHAPLSLGEEIVHVPLIFSVPGVAKKKVPVAPFSHLHLAPTLLEILDVQRPESFKGHGLWNNLLEQEAWDLEATTECVYGCSNPFRPQDRLGPRLLSVREVRYKLVMQMHPGTDEELYDLDSDPAEMHPLPVGTEKAVRKKLLRSAFEHLQKSSSNRDANMRLKARLREILVKLDSDS